MRIARFNKVHAWYAAAGLLVFSSQAFAATWLTDLGAYFNSVAKIAIGMIGVGVFLYVAYNAVLKFNEARTGRAEWGEVIILALVGAALLMITGVMLTSAETWLPKIVA